MADTETVECSQKSIILFDCLKPYIRGGSLFGCRQPMELRSICINDIPVSNHLKKEWDANGKRCRTKIEKLFKTPSLDILERGIDITLSLLRHANYATPEQIDSCVKLFSRVRDAGVQTKFVRYVHDVNTVNDEDVLDELIDLHQNTPLGKKKLGHECVNLIKDSMEVPEGRVYLASASVKRISALKDNEVQLYEDAMSKFFHRDGSYAKYKRLTNYAEFKEASITDALEKAGNKDIVFDANNIYGKYKYLVFTKESEYSKYLETYNSRLQFDGDNKVVRPPFKDQYRIIPVNLKHNLIFEIYGASPEDLANLVLLIKQFFRKITEKDILFSENAGDRHYEVVLLNTALDYSEHNIKAFMTFVEDTDPYLHEKLESKRIMCNSDEEGVERKFFIRVVQTRPVFDSKLAPVKMSPVNIINVIHQTVNVNGVVNGNVSGGVVINGNVNAADPRIEAPKKEVADVIQAPAAVTLKARNKVDASLIDAIRKECDQKNQLVRIVACNPPKDELVREYYKKIKGLLDFKCRELDIAEELKLQGYCTHKISRGTKWIKDN